MRETIRKLFYEAGATAVGFARAGETDSDFHSLFAKWVEEGKHGEMEYLRRHVPLRASTESVLPEASTVISVAYNYSPENFRSEELPCISAYSYGEDYHTVLREKLQPVVKGLSTSFGGKWRICIDSAPVSERYWALKSGIGISGKNGSVIIEGCGCFSFLVEVLTTLEIAPDEPSLKKCKGCGKCIEVCPSKALSEDGLDASRCINYLTIEKKGEFSDEEKELLQSGRGYLFGCDRCLKVCPHNNEKRVGILENFNLKDEIKNLSPLAILNMDEEEFKRRFSRSPLLYAGYERLRRNASIF